MRTESSTQAFWGSGRSGQGYRPRRATSAILLLALLALLMTTFRSADAVVPGTGFVVSQKSGDKVLPSVSGNFVVWEDKRHTTSDVYGRKITPAGEAEFQITSLPQATSADLRSAALRSSGRTGGIRPRTA